MAFFQHGPELGNTFLHDLALRSWLERVLPSEVHAAITPGLESLGGRAAGEMLALAAQAEREPPVHVPFDPWGRRVDEIRVSEAWHQLHAIAAEEGIVATAYDRRQGVWSRLHAFVRLYLYHPSSAIYSCPLAMTDGAARLIELHGDDGLEDVFEHLVSRDPEQLWTSGQWMTERSGGSDVSGTSTVATPDGGGFRLTGDKWFTSATTSEVAMTLARIESDEALSLFCLRTRDANGVLQGIRIHRLKDKLGTKALPTAELSLEDTPAVLLGERGRGVATIATMLNITRLYNACCAVGYMARGLALAVDYATRREAFGRRLIDQPLHRRTLDRLALEHRGCLALVMHLAGLLGREECGEASGTERAELRLMVPVAKLYTARRAVAAMSEVLEAFGGAGYVEDTGLPALLRDAQVLAIWEGTTNVLSLDVLRVLDRSGGETLASLRAAIAARGSDPGARLDPLIAWATEASGDPDHLQAGARELAMGLADALIGSLLDEHAAWPGASSADPAAMVAARRWVQRWSAPGPASEATEEDGLLIAAWAGGPP